jgi:hypothetical protein
MSFDVGDTVYALRVLGRSACCEAPSMLFAMRGDELEILKVHEPKPHDKTTWYEVRLKRGSGEFFVTSGDITKMKHFEFNYSEFQKELDKERARDYGGW